MLLNGIESIGSRGDFLDRTISISLPLLKHRRDEVKLWSQFDQDRGRILGGLLDCVSMAIKNRDIKIDNLPRMADFAKWVIAAEPSLGGLQKGWFMKAYSENKQAHNDIVLGSSQVAQGLIEFMQDKTTWEGMPKDLLYELELIVPRDRRKKNFPKDAIRPVSYTHLTLPTILRV